MQPEFDKRIGLIRSAGAVKRYHTVETIKTQTVAEHSWGVAMILSSFVDRPSYRLIRQALCHDMAEVLTGDVPATAKWGWPAFAKAEQEAANEFHRKYGFTEVLEDWEFELLKMADGLEGLSFCIREIELGNKLMIVIAHRWEAHLRSKFSTASEEAKKRSEGLVCLYDLLCRLLATYEEVMV